jgi:hypothetical protein
MSIASLNPEDITGSHVKIGTPSHTGRNLGLLGGVLLLGAAGFGFYRWSAGQDAQKVASLEAFRTAYADKCDAPAWRGATPALVRDTYLNSSRLQDAVARQQAALDKGVACDEVLKSLKQADFPLPTVPKVAAQ